MDRAPALRQPPSSQPAPTGIYREAEGHWAVKDLVRRFAADVVRREPGTQDDWLARLVKATSSGGGDGA